MRKTVLVLIMTTAVVLAGCGGDDDDAAEESTEASGGSSTELALNDFAFEPDAIDAEAGDTITLEIENKGDAPHTFTVDALDIDQEVQPGESAEIEVTVPDSGGVDFYCRFHQGRGMTGAIGAAGAGSGGSQTTETTAETDGGGSTSPDGY